MKTMKRFASVLLALVMIMGMATTSFAGTIVNDTDRTYDAYQIFKGTQATGDATLGNVTWGNGINHGDFLAALKADERFGKDDANIFVECETAPQVAEVLANYADKSAVVNAFADLANKHKATAMDTQVVNGNNELEAGYYLLIDTTDVAGKYDAKNAALLQVTNKSTTNITAKYDAPEIDKTVNDTDANIGDTVTFTLTATMPSTFEGYDKYKVIFHDTMSDGLTFGSITSVVVNGKPLANTEYTLEPESVAQTFTVTIDDVLAHGAVASTVETPCKVVVEYTAVLDSDAVIGTDGNPNTVYLEYSNNPNAGGEGETGNTPPDVVKVFTWEIPVFKYTGTDTPLAGAGFTLYKNDVAVNLVAAGTNGAGDLIYKVCTKTGCTDHTHVTEIVTGATGKFEIEGLEQGTYVLKETTTPAGYNTCADVTVTIGANGVLTSDNLDGNVIAILNQSGTVLPETGGIGTTIFYALGAVLMLGAGVLLVTKKRMGE